MPPFIPQLMVRQKTTYRFKRSTGFAYVSDFRDFVSFVLARLQQAITVPDALRIQEMADGFHVTFDGDAAGGSTGPAGPTGTPGTPGGAGPAGSAGTPGTPGTPGIPGASGGSPGPIGDEGDPGDPGDPGSEGSLTPGNKGATGPRGPAQTTGGPTGPLGPDGPPAAPPGITGPKGNPGPLGPPGAEAEAGPKGPPGADGTDAFGLPGFNGSPGPAGPPGSKLAIVESNHEIVGLHVLEAAEFRAIEIINFTGSGRVQIDPRFLAVCEPNSVTIIGLVVTKPAAARALLSSGHVHILCPQKMTGTVTLSGIAKGHAHKRFPEFTALQKTQNDAFWALALKAS